MAASMARLAPFLGYSKGMTEPGAGARTRPYFREPAHAGMCIG